MYLQNPIGEEILEIYRGSSGALEVQYGSDLDTSMYVSGFPHISDQKAQAIEAASSSQHCYYYSTLALY